MTKHDSKTADEYYEGKGCNCFARNQDECACDADWTPKELVELRKKNAELEEVLLSTPDAHSDEWSDCVCTFCGKADSEHETDCVYLLARHLREQAKKLKG